MQRTSAAEAATGTSRGGYLWLVSLVKMSLYGSANELFLSPAHACVIDPRFSESYRKTTFSSGNAVFRLIAAGFCLVRFEPIQPSPVINHHL